MIIDGPALDRGARPLGASITLWHPGIAFAAMVTSFLALSRDAIPTLRSLVANSGYFDAGNPLLFDQQRTGYSLQDATEHLKALGNAANAYYADTYIALYDLVFPITLLAFGVTMILYATKPDHDHALDVTPLAQRLMLAAPVALFLFDMGENLFVHTMLGMFPTVNAKVVETASMFTQLKWLAVLIEGIVLLGLIVHTLHRILDGSKRRAAD